VASQAIKEFHRDTLHPFLLRDVLPGPGWAPYRAAARPLPRAMDVVPEANEEGGSCMKGLMVGMGLESAAALGVYGLWQLWHLIR